MKKKKIIRTSLEEREPEDIQRSLRPVALKDYIGQEKVKGNIRIYIDAAKKRGEALDHCLFYGPPGLGKTTLAMIIANEMGSDIKTTAAPVIEKPGDIASVLSTLKDGDILFIDEIHRLPKNVEEVLYSAMEDYMIHIMIGSGAQGKNIRLELPKFTLIGATTRAGMLSAPLRDRFRIKEKLSFYTDGELGDIIMSSAEKLGVSIEKSTADDMGARSRGTPRIANNILRSIRDFADVINDSIIDEAIVNEALKSLGVDDNGLDENDHAIIRCIRDRFSGGPVGLKTLASCIGEDEQTIEEVYEPYLIFKGIITKTPRGRVLTEQTDTEE